MRRALLFLVFVLFCGGPSFAQPNKNDSVTITTYYPSPYGVYRELQLHPQRVAYSVCDQPNEEGRMYYDNTTKQVMVCSSRATAPINRKWYPVPGGGADFFWMGDVASPTNIHNTNAGRVGIGTGTRAPVGIFEVSHGGATSDLFVNAANGGVVIDSGSLLVNNPTGQGYIAIQGASDSGRTYSALYLGGANPSFTSNHWVLSHNNMTGSQAEDDFGIFYWQNSTHLKQYLTVDHETGKVGISTGVPQYFLDAQGNSTWGMRYTRTDARDARITVADPTQAWSIASGWASAGDFSIIQENAAGDRLYIGRGGNVGIGTTTPWGRLTVNGAVRANKGDSGQDATQAGFSFEMDGDTGLFAIGGNGYMGSALALKIDDVRIAVLQQYGQPALTLNGNAVKPGGGPFGN